ncbi:uncharacterized protein BCR38DRAFT_437847, partial [Pseudomassariella vexata]
MVAFRSTEQLQKHRTTCKATKQVKRERLYPICSPNTPDRRTCGFCHFTCESRNKLFQHLGNCKDAKVGNIKPKELEQNTVKDPDSQPRIKEAPAVDFQDRSVMSRYTYLRVEASALPTADKVEVCLDPGTGRTIIGRSYLKTLKHTIENRRGMVKGIGKKSMKVTEWATFTFYLHGTDESGPTVMKFTKSGWVVEDDLEPNMLVGNDMLHPHGANICYENFTVTFTHLYKFTVDF